MTSLISLLKKQFELQLPGFEAQNRMSPIKNRPLLNTINNNASKSAVLVLLYPKNNTPHIVLMVRQDYEGVHSGQVSLPGGRYEKRDKNFTATALRETHEEIGIDETKVEVIGELTDLYIPASNFIVYPVLGYLDHTSVFKIDTAEVKQLLEIPVSLLLDDAIVKTKPVYMSIFNEHRHVPCFDFDGHAVWGATAMMLSEVKEMLKRCTKYE